MKNENLKKGEMKTVIQGLKGASVKSSVTIEYENGTVEIKNMGSKSLFAIATINRS